MKYAKVAALFLFNSEIISLLALLIMAGMFLWDIANARVRAVEDAGPYDGR